MIWIMTQNKMSAVNLDGIIDIFIKQSKNEIVARIAPTMILKDASLSSFVDLGTYSNLDECKKVFNDILKAIKLADTSINKVIKMPPAGGELDD